MDTEHRIIVPDDHMIPISDENRAKLRRIASQFGVTEEAVLGLAIKEFSIELHPPTSNPRKKNLMMKRIIIIIFLLLLLKLITTGQIWPLF